jgi:hypothetical protein
VIHITARQRSCLGVYGDCHIPLGLPTLSTRIQLAPEIIEVAIERTFGASRQTRLQGRGGGLAFNSGLDRLQASNSRFEHALCSSADSMRSIWVYRTKS